MGPLEVVVALLVVAVIVTPILLGVMIWQGRKRR